MSVWVTAGTVPEPEETYRLVLTGATGTAIARPEGTGTIVDDDHGTPEPVVVSPTQVSSAMPPSGTSPPSPVSTAQRQAQVASPVHERGAKDQGHMATDGALAHVAVYVSWAALGLLTLRVTTSRKPPSRAPAYANQTQTRGAGRRRAPRHRR